MKSLSKLMKLRINQHNKLKKT